MDDDDGNFAIVLEKMGATLLATWMLDALCACKS
jgi:hypothetical protein